MSLDRSTAPALHPYPHLSVPFPTKRNLQGEMQLFSLNHGEQPISRLTLSWPVGTLDVDNPSALSVMALLLREGSRNYSDVEISETLDFNGAWLRVEPSYHSFNISLYALNKNFAELVSILKDIIEHPLFPENEMRAISNRVASNLEVNLQKVAFVAALENNKYMFGESHPINRFQMPDEIRSITREDVIRAYNSVLGSGAPAVYIAGQTEPIAEETIRFLNNLDINCGDAFEPVIVPAEPTSGVKKVVMPDSLQSAVTISIPTINREHPDYINLRLAVMALGGYFGSRLNMNIREDKGYTYGITASLLGFREGAYVEIRVQCDPDYVDSVIEEVKREIRRLAEEPLSDDELNAVKSYAMSTLASVLDTPFSIIEHHISNSNLRIQPDYFDAQLKVISALSASTVCRMVREHIDMDRMAITIVGR